MNGEQAPRHETPPSPERAFDERLIGLKARLLLGGSAINPSEKVSHVTKDGLGNFEQRDYSLFQGASIGERKTYWQGKEGDSFDRQKTAWVRDTNEIFHNAQSFFQTPEGKRWSELFLKMGIDTASFSAEKLYTDFFISGNESKNVKMFLEKSIAAHEAESNGQKTINTELFKQNRTALQWLAGMFGENSKEIISQLTDAEVSLATDPERFITDATALVPSPNQTQSQLRINTLLPRERELLAFLWQQREQAVQPTRTTPEPAPPGQTHPPQQRSPCREDPYRWRYHSIDTDNGRVFPNAELVSRITSPQHIAEMLREQNPTLYATTDHELAQLIAVEQETLERTLAQHGLPQQELERIALSSINEYEEFVKREYGITIPEIENIVVLPISGTTAQALHGNSNAFAFVDTKYNAIFLDMDHIMEEARSLGVRAGNGWQTMSGQELGSLIKRLLEEVHPHEYTHLIGHIAFWKLMKKEEGTETYAGDIMGAKIGIKVGRPLHKENESVSESDYVERGLGLSEAVTVELTNKWARSIGGRLDIDAYSEERQVLDTLTTLLAREQGISKEEAFKKFAKAYFTPKDFRHLTKELSGRRDEQGGYKRPHFLAIVYGLMEYEHPRMGTQPNARYDLTLNFINNNLDSQQKAEILQKLPDMKFSPSTKGYLQQFLATRPVQQAA